MAEVRYRTRPTPWQDVRVGEVIAGAGDKRWIVCHSVAGIKPGTWHVRVFDGRQNKEHVVSADAKTARVICEDTLADALDAVTTQINTRVIHQEG